MRTRIASPGAALCAILLLGIPQAALGQFRAAVQGTIKDTSGAVVPGAKVTLTSNETQRKQTVTASGEGFYHFAGLAPGSYSIEASANGMRTAELKDVTVAAESTA